MVDTNELTYRTKKYAQSLGFELTGVTKPDRPAHIELYKRWIIAQHHGEMDYLASPRAVRKREFPLEILPDCRSILVLGHPYPGGPNHHAQNENPFEYRGKIAAYAYGEDYHQIFSGKLKSIVHFIQNQVNQQIPNRWYTDTGPVLERDFAVAAGLGWIGKNTLLINPLFGSYVLLAVIFLGIDLVFDIPFSEDRCGSCTRCIEQCPTGCILPDRTIDARACISYLTIELKGQIPVEHRSAMGDWVFGCDVCQQVCPWNRRTRRVAGKLANEIRAKKPSPVLKEEIILSRGEFNRKFRNSAVKRAKRRGYLRNIAVALGNTFDPENVPILSEILKTEGEPLVRAHAAWALGQIGDLTSLDALNRSNQVEDNLDVKEEIQRAIDRWS